MDKVRIIVKRVLGYFPFVDTKIVILDNSPLLLFSAQPTLPTHLQSKGRSWPDHPKRRNQSIEAIFHIDNTISVTRIFVTGILVQMSASRAGPKIIPPLSGGVSGTPANTRQKEWSHLL